MQAKVVAVVAVELVVEIEADVVVVVVTTPLDDALSVEELCDCDETVETLEVVIEEELRVDVDPGEGDGVATRMPTATVARICVVTAPDFR